MIFEILWLLNMTISSQRCRHQQQCVDDITPAGDEMSTIETPKLVFIGPQKSST